MRKIFSLKHITSALALMALMGILAITAPINYEWGTTFTKVKSTLPTGKEIEQFTPQEKPKYKNKILNHITAIDENLRTKIIILRVRTRPIIDYLFVNKKLYTIMEDWGEIDLDTETSIKNTLTGRYGQPMIQQYKNYYIFSYTSDKTKVLYYLLKQQGGKSRCKVYYYTKQLFKKLLTE